MKKVAALIVTFFFLAAPVFATSQQAYSDYLYQFQQYRQNYSDFQVAQNAYLKFNTLQSQSQALTATKTMLSERDTLLHAYLLYLFERVGEQGGMTTVNRQLYQSLLTNELSFLETQSGLVSSINSIDDATSTSQQLEDHYEVLQATIDEIITGISLAQLNVIYQNFNLQVTAAQNIFQQNSSTMSSAKQATVNSWITQITSQQSLYQQKIADINTEASTLTNINDAGSLDQAMQDITTKLGQAKQYVSDSIANLREVENAMQYTN